MRIVIFLKNIKIENVADQTIYTTQVALAISQLWRLAGHLQNILKILIKVAGWITTWQFKEGPKETEKENIWMVVEKMRKGKKKFERKTKRYKLCREEMEVTEKPKIVALL